MAAWQSALDTAYKSEPFRPRGVDLSQNDSFIDEVNEEIRRDRLFAAFKKYGWIPALGVILLVGGTSYIEWRKARAEARAEVFGDAIYDALSKEGAERSAALDSVATEGAGEAAVLALMRSASGDAAALKGVQTAEGIEPLYRDLATLKLLMMNADNLDPEARKAAFEQLALPGAPFRLIAQEQIALIDVEAGNTEAAIETFRQIAEDSEATTGLRRRANDMLTVLGGLES